MSLMLAPELRKSNDRNQGSNRLRALYLVHHMGDPHMEAHCIESKTKTQCAFLDTLQAATIPILVINDRGLNSSTSDI